MKTIKIQTYLKHIKNPIWLRKMVIWMMIVVMTTQPVLVSAEVIVDANAPGQNRPTIENSASNLPIVQITAPTAAGVSRNIYQQFNVDSRGLILNNSRIITQTQLAGYITGNPNLVNGSARIILNEVTGNNPSYLRGYTEVAGQKAEVIIANPNGIYGDGFGFINTSRAVLTTGTPVFGGSGSLDAFRVTGGQIAIQGAGMNATDVDQVDLISRSVAINAGAWAKNLNVIAGSNKVDYNTLQSQGISGDASTGQIAIDVGQLGGMYAQKIYMVGTENGVGVNSKGTIAAQAGDITINSAGKVMLAGNTSATGNIQILAQGDVVNNNTLYAQGNTHIITQGILKNNENGTILAGQHTTLQAESVTSTGTLGAGVKTDSTLGSAGDLTINTSGKIVARGQNMVAGNLMIGGSEIDIANSKTYVQHNANMTATIGDINTSGVKLDIGGTFTVNAQGTIKNDKNENGVAAEIKAGQLIFSANKISNQGSTLTQFGTNTTVMNSNEDINNTAGEILTNGNHLKIKANSLINNAGKIGHAGIGVLEINTIGDIKNENGKLESNGKIELTAHDIDNVSGTIGGNGSVQIIGNSLVNQSGKITTQDNLLINVHQGLDHEAKGDSSHDSNISSGGDLTITSDGKVFLIGNTTAGGNLSVHATEGIQNQSALYAHGNTNLTTQGAMENLGTLLAGQNMVMVAKNIVSSGTVGAGITSDGKLGNSGDVTMTGDERVTVSGKNMVAGNLLIQAVAINLAGSKTYAGNQVTLTATNGDIDHTASSLEAGGALTATAKGMIRNTNGAFVSNGQINLQAQHIDNTKGTIAAQQRAEIISRSNLLNSQGIISSADKVTINAQGVVNNQLGSIEATKGLELSGQSLNNQNGRVVNANNLEMKVVVNAGIDNQGGTIVSNGQVQVTGASLANQKGQVISNGDLSIIMTKELDNTDGKLIANEKLTINQTAGNLNNTRGTIGAGNDLMLQATTIENKAGKVEANKNIKFSTQSINGNGQVSAGQNLEMNLTGDFTNGVDSGLKANENMTITTTGAIINQGKVSGSAVTFNGKNIKNTGAIFADNLTITADDITNEGPLAVMATTGNTNLYARGALENKDDATIYSMGNIVVAGSNNKDDKGQYTDSTGSVLNQSATIEADKNISITANLITNKKREFVTEQVVVSTKTTQKTESIPKSIPHPEQSDSSGGYYYDYGGTKTGGYYVEEDSLLPVYYAAGRVTYVQKDQTDKVTITETKVIKDSPVGKIMSGGNMTLRAGFINNEVSWMLANGTLDTVASEVNNKAVGIVRVTSHDGEIVYKKHHFARASHSSGVNQESHCDKTDFYDNEIIPNHTITAEQLSSYSSLYGGGQAVSIQATTINNQTIQPPGAPVGDIASTVVGGNRVTPVLTSKINSTVDNTGATTSLSGQNKQQITPISNVGSPLITLPANSLYIIHKEPGNKPLVETDPRFSSYKNFISSDYMLKQLQYNPGTTQKRLGDGFYEQKLVREQITNLTGRSSLSPSTSSEDEFKNLMNSGITYAKEYNLQAGVALTPEQMTKLTSDIVWLVEKEVEGQKVLVPVVYLSQVKQHDLKLTGALITGDKVDLTAIGDINNSGVIQGNTQTNITALNISNRGGVIDGGNETKLVANHDIINQSGRITGGNLELSARDIKNETLISPVDFGVIKTTMINQAGAIVAKDSLTVKADRDIIVTGAKLSAGQGIELKAGRNVDITSVQHQQQLNTVLADLQVSYGKTTNISSSIKAGGNLTISSHQDITLQGSQLEAGKDVILAADKTLEVSAVENREIGTAKDKGISFWKDSNSDLSYSKTTNVVSGIKSGSNVTLAANDINLHGAQVEADKNIKITAERNLTVTAVQNTSNIQVHEGISSILNKTVAISAIGLGSSDIASIPGGNNNGFGEKIDYTNNISKNVTTKLIAGENVNLKAQNDVVLQGIQVNAKKDIDLAAGGNIAVTAVKDQQTTYSFKGNDSAYVRTRTNDEFVVGSQLNAQENINIIAGPSAIEEYVIKQPNIGQKLSTGTTTEKQGEITASTIVKVVPKQKDISKGNIIIEGSSINSTKGIATINADHDITIKNAVESHEQLKETREVSSGFFSSTVTEARDYSLINQVKSSTISGEQVNISSGKDLTVQGSNVVATNDVSLKATNNVNILSAKETGKDEHFREETTSGLFSGGGLGFTIGSKSEKTTNNDQTLDEIGSTIGSIKGNVTITAGDKVNSAGTTFVAEKDLSITGKDVTIDNTINTIDSQYKYEFKQTGLSVSLGGGIVDTATSAYNNINRSSQVQDDRLKALYDYKAVKDIQKLGDYKGNLKKDLGLSISFGSTQTTTEQTSHTETMNASNINAGGNVTIKATTGDVNLQGTNIDAKDITLDAKNNINIDSGENKQQTTSNTSSSSWSVGGTVGVGFNASASKGSGSENEKITTNAGSVINATGTLTLKSGDDTNITGSKVKGDKVVANIGGDLNIASVQDTDNYTAKNQSMGVGVSTGQTGPKDDKKSIGGTTGSFNTGKTNSNYASVTDQAGIFAGKDGFDITVGKNTDLKGAVIASMATPGKNKISTGSLTWSDIENKADYNSSSVGVSVSTGKDGKGVTPNIGVPAKGDASSTTKSAIEAGTITITGKQTQDLSKLSRDTSGAVNTLGKIFDKKTVEEQQELAKVFGEEAYKAVGDMSSRKVAKAKEADIAAELCKELAADARKLGNDDLAKVYEQNAESLIQMSKDTKASWGEGGTMKILLHGVVGGLVADMGGGNLTAGFVGASVSEAYRKELEKLSPEEHRIASIIIGATATKIVGGNSSDVQTGAVTAIDGTKNNFEMPHPDDLSSRDVMIMVLGGPEAINYSDDDLVSMFVKAAEDATFKDMIPGSITVVQGVSAFNKKIAGLPMINKIPGAKMVATADMFIQFPSEIVKNISKNYDVEGYTIEMALADAFRTKGIDTARDLTVNKACDILAKQYELGYWEKYMLKKTITEIAKKCGIKGQG